MRLIGLNIIVALFFASCSSDVVFEEYQTTSPNITWSKDDVKTFEVAIKEEGQYDIYFMLRYVTGYPWDVAHVAVEIDDLSKKNSEQKLFTFQLKDETGELLAEPSLDLWDIKQKFALDTILPQGNYHFSFQHAMGIEPFPYVMEVGVRVEKSKK